MILVQTAESGSLFYNYDEKSTNFLRYLNKCFKVDEVKKTSMFIPRKILEKRVLQLLAEDVGQGDVTTEMIVPQGQSVEASIIAKETGIVAGIEETCILIEALDLKVEACVLDGAEVEKGKAFLKICGDGRTILSAERTILNLLSRMSGIATTTKRLVNKLSQGKTKPRIAATRKSAPGLLYFDKKAVLVGGGDPHRLHLDDMVLIKENHIALAGGIKKAVEKAKHYGSFTKKVEVEVTRAADSVVAAKAGADIIMLDNLTPKQIKQAVESLKKSGFRGKILLEASGGINEASILEYASTGVDILSIGGLTHSAKALDMSLEITGFR